jgi:hypothetical protein
LRLQGTCSKVGSYLIKFGVLYPYESICNKNQLFQNLFEGVSGYPVPPRAEFNHSDISDENRKKPLRAKGQK